MTLPNKIRLRIIDILDRSLQTRKEVSITLGVSYRTVVRVYDEYLKSGKVSALSSGGKKPKKLNTEQMIFLRDCIDEDCTLTLKELKNKIYQKYEIIIGALTISNYIFLFRIVLREYKQ
jgi:transposase